MLLEKEVKLLTEVEFDIAERLKEIDDEMTQEREDLDKL
jgi:hypothetical protein